MKEERNENGLIRTVYMRSAIGNVKISGSPAGIKLVQFTDDFEESSDQPEGILLDGLNQLDEYFQGKRKEFSVKLDLHGSVFQKKIWNELLKIPFGKTISYMELAMKHGDVKAIRAVGLANSKNPVAIIVPCHRVIGANGELTGYAGGMPRKKWLLELEGSLQPDLFSAKKAL